MAENIITTESIKKTLISAIDKTFRELEFISGSLNEYDFPEYYLTSNIVQQLRKDYIESPGDPYKIVLEEKTEEFSRSCVPLFGESKDEDESPFGKMIISKPKNTKRNGKIDICVYQDDNAYCCLEVKGNNPPSDEILKDLKRMTELFEIEDRTGENSLQFAVLPFVYDVTSKWFTESRLKNIINTKTEYASQIDSPKVKWSFVLLADKKYESENFPDDEDYREHSYHRLYCAYIGIPVTTENL